MDAIKTPKVDNVRLAKLSHQFGSSSSAPSSTQESNEQSGLLGSLLITPNHLIWTHSHNTQSNQPNPEPGQSSLTSSDISDQIQDVWISHSLLTAVQHLPRHRQPTLLIRLATFVFYTLSFNSPSELDDVWDSLKALISNRKPGEKEHLYAFLQAASSKSSTSPTDPSSSFPGWNSYDPHAEFTRMKVIGESSKNLENNAWRLTTINKDFNFCST